MYHNPKGDGHHEHNKKPDKKVREGGCIMWVVHQRLAQLWQIKKYRLLTQEEKKEFYHCLDANMNKCRRVAALKNLSLLASMTDDTDWNHEICSQLDKLYVDLY